MSRRGTRSAAAASGSKPASVRNDKRTLPRGPSGLRDDPITEPHGGIFGPDGGNVLTGQASLINRLMQVFGVTDAMMVLLAFYILVGASVTVPVKSFPVFIGAVIAQMTTHAKKYIPYSKYTIHRGVAAVQRAIDYALELGLITKEQLPEVYDGLKACWKSHEAEKNRGRVFGNDCFPYLKDPDLLQDDCKRKAMDAAIARMHMFAQAWRDIVKTEPPQWLLNKRSFLYAIFALNRATRIKGIAGITKGDERIPGKHFEPETPQAEAAAIFNGLVMEDLSLEPIALPEPAAEPLNPSVLDFTSSEEFYDRKLAEHDKHQQRLKDAETTRAAICFKIAEIQSQLSHYVKSDGPYGVGVFLWYPTPDEMAEGSVPCIANPADVQLLQRELANLIQQDQAAYANCFSEFHALQQLDDWIRRHTACVEQATPVSRHIVDQHATDVYDGLGELMGGVEKTTPTTSS